MQETATIDKVSNFIVQIVFQIVELLFELFIELLGGDAPFLALLQFAVQPNRDFFGDEKLFFQIYDLVGLAAKVVELVLEQTLVRFEAFVSFLEFTQLELQDATILGRDFQFALQLTKLVGVVHAELILQLFHLVANVLQFFLQCVVVEFELLIQVVGFG